MARLKLGAAGEHELSGLQADRSSPARSSYSCLGAVTKARRQTATRGRATLLKGTEPTSQPGWAVPLQRQPHATDYQQLTSGCIYHSDRRLQPGGLLWETTARRESSRKAIRHGIHTIPGPARLAGSRIEQPADRIC